MAYKKMMKKFRSLEEELNIEQKRMFHKWLTKAVDDENFDLFKNVVKFIGEQWSVIRTVKSEKFHDFCLNLWNEMKSIKGGTYRWYDNSEFNAYSYESKICFLLYPNKYKLIYDKNNCCNLSKPENKEKIENYFLKNRRVKLKISKTDTENLRKNWQQIVNAFYDLKLHGKGKIKEGEEFFEDYYMIDFESWLNGMKASQIP